MVNLVTVIIPCYNDGPYIKKAVDSILNQTFADYKIIIVDDGSNETTKNVLSKINNKKIEIHYQDNQGVSCARNKAITLTKSEYILTLDADDYFEPTFLEKAVKILNSNHKIGVVGCSYNVIIDNKLQKIVNPIGGSIDNFLLKNEGLGNSLFRRVCWEEVNGYDEKMKLGYEDWEFWIAILSRGWQMKIIDEPLFNYRLKSVSRDKIALKNHDLELRKYIFNKHKEVYKVHFEKVTLSLFDENEKLRKKKVKLQKSKEYKLGKLLVSPLKRIVNKL